TNRPVLVHARRSGLHGARAHRRRSALDEGESWAPMAVADVQGQLRRYQYQCQHCAPDGRAIRRIPN
ncbi:MAG TPA: hypothetical protein VHJ58_15875, partial [Vicinamibacterales bacterium]|nr:hypothetical protein [Vicinamibacterales bacterium]